MITDGSRPAKLPKNKFPVKSNLFFGPKSFYFLVVLGCVKLLFVCLS